MITSRRDVCGCNHSAKTPHAIAEKLHAEIMKALALPAVQDRLTAVGVDPMPMTMTEFSAFFKKDIANNLALVKAAKTPTQKVVHSFAAKQLNASASVCPLLAR